MNVMDAVESYMEQEGFNGLYSHECACTIDDLRPCSDDMSKCRFGVRIECKACDERDSCDDYVLMDGDCDYYVVPIGFCDKAAKVVDE